MTGHLRPRTVAVVALAIGLAATALAWFIAGRQVEREGLAKFQQQANLASGLLERRIQRYIDVLYGLEALAYHDQTLSRSTWRPAMNHDHAVAARPMARATTATVLGRR